ncbi:MAG TPA: hypothetical protein VK447_15700 [Myxococcaceae bacterium]|nr:hypothetical protein [Myxococcaceae bacterium]
MALGWRVALGCVAGAAVFSLAVQYPPSGERPQLTLLASVAWPVVWLYAVFAASRWARAQRLGAPGGADTGPALTAEARLRLARQVVWSGATSGLVIAAVSTWALLALDAFERSRLRLTAFAVLVGWLGVSVLLLRPYRARR